MSLRDDLIAAKALIDRPEKWGKGRNRVALADGTACYCTAGALYYATRFCGNVSLAADRASACEDALAGLLPPIRYTGIRGFNDDPSTTHADIMALFDRAIAAAGDAK